MQTGSIRYYLSILAQVLTLSAAQAQSTEGFLRDDDAAHATSASVLLPSFIGTCGRTSTALCAMSGDPVESIHNTVTLQIPDFKIEDLATHVHVMVGVSESGEVFGSTLIDEFGMMYSQDTQIRQPGGDFPQAVDKQYFFVITALSTLEARVTLDLFEVRLWPLLRSLQLGIENGVRRATASSYRSGTGMQVHGGQQLIQADIRLSIHGERLSIDEVLDIIYLETGCVVEQTAEALVVVACP